MHVRPSDCATTIKCSHVFYKLYSCLQCAGHLIECRLLSVCRRCDWDDDCGDKSDEPHSCWNTTTCQDGWSRCRSTYRYDVTVPHDQAGWLRYDGD